MTTTISTQGIRQPKLNRDARFWFVMIVTCLIMTLISARLIQNDSIKGDATQNLAIAYSLFKDGSFSLSEPPHTEPTNFREPLPPFVTAVYLTLFKGFTTPFTHKSLQSGEHARFAKLQNLLWVYFGLIGTWLLYNSIAKTRWQGLVATFGVFVFYFNSVYTVNTMYTELIAATLLIWLSISLVHAADHQTLKNWIWPGVILGMLCLTKALFLYLVPFLILLFSIYASYTRHNSNKIQKTLIRSTIMVLSTSILVAPWMIRNQLNFDSPQLTQGRSGWVLYKRALLNDMGDDEFRRGFTLWGPVLFQKMVVNTPLELKPEDVKTWNGPLRRLYYGKSEFMANDHDAQAKGSPQQAVTLYRKTSALYVELAALFRKAGHLNPEYAGDKVMQTVAISRMVANPTSHIKVSSLMFWRGFWCFSPMIELPPLKNREKIRAIVEVLNLLSGCALIYLMAIGLARNKYGFLALAAPSVFMMGFYALLSQNLPRFNAPAQPLMILALVTIILGVKSNTDAQPNRENH